MNDELQLPSDIEVEKAILGEILLSLDNGWDIFDSLNENLFFNRSNRVIFQTMALMVKENQKVDMVTVTSKMNDLKILDEAGGIGYISTLHKSGGRLPSAQYLPILEEKLKLRNIIDFSSKAQRAAYGNEESSKIIESIQSQTFGLQLENKSGNLLEESCNNILKMIEARKNGERVFGLKTGIQPWDMVLGGMNPRFYVLAARAGRGKSAMVEQIISEQLKVGNPTLIFQKDMSPELFVLRMSCRAAEVPFTKYDLGHCSRVEYEEIEKLVKFYQKTPFFLYSPSGFTIETFVSIVKKEKRLHGIKSVFLDHILNLSVGKNYREGLTMASLRIRDSVQENNIPHVILAQLNRGAHNTERPTPAHIKEFDALYADCDAMMMLWSDKEDHEYPNPRELFPCKFTVNKNRYGTVFEETMGFDRPLMTFRNLKL